MTITININGLSLCHKGSNGWVHNTLPDVCKTPAKGVPVPYENEAYSRDLVKGTTTCFADGGHMIANLGSEFAISVFDEPGTMGGVKSGTNMAEADWITHSFDVFFEGKPACRLTDKMFMNHRNTVSLAGEQQLALSEREIRDDLCPAICYCSSAWRAAPEATELATDADFWQDVLEKQGSFNPDAITSRTKQECVAKQFSSGWPIYTPDLAHTDMLPEVTYSVPDFGPLMSGSTPPRTTYPGGPTAPASPPRAMGQVGKGKTYGKGETVRWDFTVLKDPSKPVSPENLGKYVEIKFDGDELTKNQKEAVEALKERGESDKLLVIEESDCGCGDEKRARQKQDAMERELTGEGAPKPHTGPQNPPFLPGPGGIPIPI